MGINTSFSKANFILSKIALNNCCNVLPSSFKGKSLPKRFMKPIKHYSLYLPINLGNIIFSNNVGTKLTSGSCLSISSVSSSLQAYNMAAEYQLSFSISLKSAIKGDQVNISSLIRGPKVSSSEDMPSKCELNISCLSRSQRRLVRLPSRSAARRTCSSYSAPRRVNFSRLSSRSFMPVIAFISTRSSSSELSPSISSLAKRLPFLVSTLGSSMVMKSPKKNDNNNLTTKSSVRISVWILSLLLLLLCSVELVVDVEDEPKL
ncbi:hypothetical protein FF38_04632 [Lucilia cuprina]|uniref:Uncharacterized protein n=1 Tax=Lucilia cuprina TaxID=7375 RepID=A0A0L0BWH5_LUCCU|nr:hypothetical protein FF38_04632 [Lucilia cuprina]